MLCYWIYNRRVIYPYRFLSIHKKLSLKYIEYQTHAKIYKSKSFFLDPLEAQGVTLSVFPCGTSLPKLLSLFMVPPKSLSGVSQDFLGSGPGLS